MSGGCLAIEVEEASNSSAATVIVDVKGDNEDGAAGVSLALDADDGSDAGKVVQAAGLDGLDGTRKDAARDDA